MMEVGVMEAPLACQDVGDFKIASKTNPVYFSCTSGLVVIDFVVWVFIPSVGLLDGLGTNT